MSNLPADIEQRTSLYAARRGLTLDERRLGYGQNGTVYATDAPSAVKTHARRKAYRRELDCYRRLRDHSVLHVRGHRVPQLIAWDDELWVVEMTIVWPPFVLDFADSQLDQAPDFPDEVMEEWHDEKREQFGDRWDDVQLVLAFLRGHYGIHLLDVHPGNITFGRDET